MLNPELAGVTTLRQQKILDRLKTGACTWEVLRASTGVNDDNLGFVIGELLGLRKIWTVMRGDQRLYGIERRADLVPRFAQEQRRSEDLTI